MPARTVAYEVLRRTFEHDAWADRAFRSAAERHGLEGRERAQAQRLSYGAVQRRGTSDHLVAELAGRPVDQLDPPLRAALRLGMYELLFAAGSADHAAVGEAVELAKRGGATGGNAARRAKAAAGLVNAVLRRAAREREALLAALDDSTPAGAAVAHSMPLWISELWWRELGADSARALMRVMNEPAEQALRANTLRVDPEDLLGVLREGGEPVARPSGAPGLLAPAEALVASGAWGEVLRARLAAGEMVAQSRASQAVVSVLDPGPGDRVLDLCAGPGIKTTGMAARMKNEGEIRSLELDPARAGQISELAGLLGASAVRVEVADAADADLGAGYDRILVDPPCTDLGTLASRPDARWRKTASQAERLAALQRTLLTRAAAALAPGGSLVYSTCTISRLESEAVVEAALAGDPGLEADGLGAREPSLASPHDARFLQTRPDRDRTSGFFIARLTRRGG